MIKPTLFVDIDGVMADSISWWLTLFNIAHGTNHKIEDVTGWDTRDCINADLSPYFNNYTMVRPIENAFAAIDILSPLYRIVFATVGQGSDWLKQYMVDPEIIACKDKSLLRGYALIDDRPQNLDVFVGEKFLLSQPWNRNRGLNDTTWPDIVEYLLSSERNIIMNPKDQIEQAIEDLKQITNAAEQVSNTMSNPRATQEDYDRALQEGMKVLEEMEQKRGGIDL